EESRVPGGGGLFRNFDPFAKKAVSYSSPSTTNSGPAPRRHDCRKFVGTPPIKNEGSRPASLSRWASSDELVVLLCVPATTTERLSARNSLPNSDGKDSSATP